MELPGVPSALLTALWTAAGSARIQRLALVGGQVRDQLLHQRHGLGPSAPADLDLVVEGDAAQLAQHLIQQCGEERIRGLQCHAAFGTVALELDGRPLDLAMARQEVYPFPAENPQVRPGSLLEDLSRRDFTINAMALDLLSGELVDPHQGQRDLAAGRLVFLHGGSVGDDPTRVIRAARYAARLGFGLSPEACRQVSATIKAWPWQWSPGDLAAKAPPALASRLRMELDRLLEREPWKEALDYLEQWQALALLDQALQIDPQRSRRLRWAARLGLPLLPVLLAAASDPEAVAERLEIPGRQQQWLKQLPTLQRWLRCEAPSVNASPAAWTEAVEGRGWSPELVALAVALQPPQWKSLLRWWGRWRHIKSTRTAQELLAEGWVPGAALGVELRRLRRRALERSR